MNSLASYNNPAGSSSPFPSNQTDYNSQPRKMAYTPTNSDHLNTILDSVASQIQQLDRKVKWKLELTVIEDQPHHLSKAHQDDFATKAPISSSTQHNSGHRLSTSSASEPSLKDTHTLAITSRTEYPWDFVVPLSDKPLLSKDDIDDLQDQLKQSYERQKYLQDIIHAQAEQISRSYPLSNEAEQAITTMRSIFLSMGNEQKLRYTAEMNMQQKEIEILGRKLHRMANILQTTENIRISSEVSKMEKDDLLLERQQLLRKLHLNELRLSARDIEMNYIIKQYEQQRQQLLQQQSPSLLPLKRHSSNISTSGRGASPSPDFSKTARQSPTPQFNRKGGSPYLFQQQYSPKMRSRVRPSSTHRHHPHQKLSGIDSLGYLADQMLSDPDFDHNNPSPVMASSPLKQSTALLTSRYPHQSEHYQNPIKTITQRGHVIQLAEPSSSSQQQYSHCYPNDKTSYENPEDHLMARHLDQSKRPIPVLSSSFHPITESPDPSGNRVKLFNIAHWTLAEDAQLRKQVLLHGPLGHWGDIAGTIPGRSPQQCQERWGIIHSAPTKP
ncbi:hypothetical protein BCR42DRAFT_404277 [Absidia repens]|uniref:Uncharacterized protein n=1 Tax=Absidia repens TaxID=90262 RepID=A0A1X2IW08_9FUNG|nr:hypothetical protein BCR42DRAFT_404277 [Absidia repens]